MLQRSLWVRLSACKGSVYRVLIGVFLDSVIRSKALPDSGMNSLPPGLLFQLSPSRHSLPSVLLCDDFQRLC